MAVQEGSARNPADPAEAAPPDASAPLQTSPQSVADEGGSAPLGPRESRRSHLHRAGDVAGAASSRSCSSCCWRPACCPRASWGSSPGGRAPTRCEEQAFEHLTDIRQERTTALQAYFSSLRASAVTNSRGIAVQAMRDLAAGYAALADAPISAEQRAALDAYYRDSFVPQLQARLPLRHCSSPRLRCRHQPARTYLQCHYTIASDDFDEKLAVDDAGDGSDW